MGDIASAISEEMGAPLPLANKAQAPAVLVLMTVLEILKNYEFEQDLGSAKSLRSLLRFVALSRPGIGRLTRSRLKWLQR